ncbi:MAG TPA: fibronectin type III domain-containing protein [Hymenobacter sp.]
MTIEHLIRPLDTETAFRFWGCALFQLFLLVALQLAARAQVANDNIENRRVLQTDELVTSSTTGCTVQRSCVDERLTGKCIEYHNDQWFEFIPTASGRYFVNIGGQKCRDVRGVQLVVLTGQPCQPATYRVLSCTSLGTQDDVFVTLDSLRAGQPYLLDVDGYLKDFCQFTLQVSSRAVGMPVSYFPPSPTRVLPTASRVVELSWTLPDSLATAPGFRVMRREVHQYRSTEVNAVPVRRDTYGQPLRTYTVTDTLPGPGTYDYQVVTAKADAGPTPTRLRQWWYAYGPGATLPGAEATRDVVELPLRKYPTNARLSVVITNPASGRVLLTQQLVNQPRNRRQGQVSVRKWQDAGIEKIAVEIICHPPRGHFFTDRLLVVLPSQTMRR